MHDLYDRLEALLARREAAVERKNAAWGEQLRIEDEIKFLWRELEMRRAACPMN